jgi:hypothetical protein
MEPEAVAYMSIPLSPVRDRFLESVACVSIRCPSSLGLSCYFFSFYNIIEVSTLEVAQSGRRDDRQAILGAGRCLLPVDDVCRGRSGALHRSTVGRLFPLVPVSERDAAGTLSARSTGAGTCPQAGGIGHTTCKLQSESADHFAGRSVARGVRHV